MKKYQLIAAAVSAGLLLTACSGSATLEATQDNAVGGSVEGLNRENVNNNTPEQMPNRTFQGKRRSSTLRRHFRSVI